MVKEKNTKLSSLSLSERDAYLKRLASFKMEYQDTLCMPSDVTFGIELEFINSDFNTLKKLSNVKFANNSSVFYSEDYWTLKPDPTLSYEDGGLELCSPVLHDTRETWDELKNICLSIKEAGGQIDENCALHVHIGADYFLEHNTEKLLNFLKAYGYFDPLLYRFATGEYQNLRAHRNEQNYICFGATTIFSKFKNNSHLPNLPYDRVLEYFCRDFSRYHGINFRNLKENALEKPTIEYRYMNGSINPTIIQNAVCMAYNFIKYTSSSRYDSSYITEHFEENKPKPNLTTWLLSEPGYSYDDLFYFVDEVFDTDYAKDSFNRQYLTSTDPLSSGKLVKATTFTK